LVAVARWIAIACVALAVWFAGVAIVDGDDLGTVVGVTFNLLFWVTVLTSVVRWVRRRRRWRGSP
jgi:hypothetical protein